MREHLSNGQFASNEVTDAQNKQAPKKRGRPKGSLNKTTRKVKEFLAALCDNADVQEAVQERILKGDAVAFFRALEHVVGKPKETTDISGKVDINFRWLGE
jgi:hypothetical protein